MRDIFRELPYLTWTNSHNMSSLCSYSSPCSTDKFFLVMIYSVFVLSSTILYKTFYLVYCINPSTKTYGPYSVHVCGMTDRQDFNLSCSS